MYIYIHTLFFSDTSLTRNLLPFWDDDPPNLKRHSLGSGRAVRLQHVIYPDTSDYIPLYIYVYTHRCNSLYLSSISIVSLYLYYTGWWYTYPSEKYEFVSWDDDIPNMWKNKKCSKHQPVCVYIYVYYTHHYNSLYLSSISSVSPLFIHHLAGS